MNKPQPISTDSLYERRDELVKQYEDLDDRLNTANHNLSSAKAALQQCRTEYVIEPANEILAGKLKLATTNYDGLVALQTELIDQRKEIGLAIDTVKNRIQISEAKTLSEHNSYISSKLPDKVLILEMDLLRALSRYQVANKMKGGGHSEPSITAGRLTNRFRDAYLTMMETAKGELVQEMCDE